MALTKFEPGINTSFSSELNQNTALVLRASGLNTVRQLINRDIDFSVGPLDCFADAYTDATGREDTVDTTSSTATFSTNKYTAGTGGTEKLIYHNIPDGRLPTTVSASVLVPFIADWESGADIQYKLQSGQVVSGETVHNPQSIGNSSNAFDGNVGTSTSSITLTVATHLGKTFASAKNIINAQFTSTLTGSGSTDVSVEYYNGSVWTSLGTLSTLTGAGVIAYTVPVNRSCNGIRVKYTASGGHGLTFQEIYIREVVEDTGWLSCGTTTPLSSFSAFTAQPFVCIVKLIPKSSSPTSGYPSIRGIALYAE